MLLAFWHIYLTLCLTVLHLHKLNLALVIIYQRLKLVPVSFLNLLSDTGDRGDESRFYFLDRFQFTLNGDFNWFRFGFLTNTAAFRLTRLFLRSYKRLFIGSH